MATSGGMISPHPQIKVFVSYAREYTAIRTTFIAKLSDPALDQATHFWIDERGDLGSDWERVLGEQLRNSAIKPGRAPSLDLTQEPASCPSRFAVSLSFF
jgi:hypothetical protein